MIDLSKDYKVVTVDFRDHLSPPKTGFDKDVTEFLQAALETAMEKFDDEFWYPLDDQMKKRWFELMQIAELWDATDGSNMQDLAELTGLSEDEMYFLKATAAAEVIGIDITDLEKSAAQHDIYGPNFPNRAHDGTPSYPYRDDLNGKPAP